ncbi:hypothetical protein POM88_049061 [Heracleum sosnowskyi]|uniref:Leucine-rich repeat-containing N-terminal plant-type domain-containing protein n=1 Tax=Heracleum sosnowskyi TaxID=360622 RepID=A0AAD8GUY9_9APIA|nr:hypothetical protein POM88_049061 [Heracleum sosnowskyi]
MALGENEGIWAWTRFNQLFNYVPLAALIEKKIIFCNWTGIRCNAAGTVSQIMIYNQEVNGTLAHFNFSSFSHLTYLDMSINNISGGIPVDIGNATRLEKLSLFSNSLNGNTP